MAFSKNLSWIYEERCNQHFFFIKIYGNYDKKIIKNEVGFMKKKKIPKVNPKMLQEIK